MDYIVSVLGEARFYESLLQAVKALPNARDVTTTYGPQVTITYTTDAPHEVETSSAIALTASQVLVEEA